MALDQSFKSRRFNEAASAPLDGVVVAPASSFRGESMFLYERSELMSQV